eukprot:8507812-Alexandrium_andersonii.AAC.1
MRSPARPVTHMGPLPTLPTLQTLPQPRFCRRPAKPGLEIDGQRTAEARSQTMNVRGGSVTHVRA